MAGLELETIERAVRWCAEAGRQTTPVEVRAALAPLGWDQLLAVRALLANPPPGRPLGPHALANLGRGVPADVAAEREREQRYPRAGAVPSGPPAGSTPSAPGPTARARASRRSRRAQVVVRKAVAAAPAPPLPATRLPLLEELLLPAGRGELERLLRKHGGRRPHLVAALGATHRRAGGAAIGDADLDAALEHHGLDRAFARRERDELRHAVRAAGAVLSRAASALGHDLAGLGAAIARLGLDTEVMRLREARRRDLRARATLAERALLLVGSTDLLADLELLAEFELDLRKRLPGHLRALSSTAEPLELGLARTLAIPGEAVRTLLERLGVDLHASAPAPRTPAGPAAGAFGRPARVREAASGPGPTSRRPPAGRPGRDRPLDPLPPVGHTSGSRPSGSRPSGSRPSGPRPSGSRPSGSRPSGSRPSGSRPSGSRPSGSRPSGSRPSGSRPSGSRPSGSRPSGSRPSGSRPSDSRNAGDRWSGARTAGPRRPNPSGGRRPPR